MKVKELKEYISKLSDDHEVWIQMSSGCCGDTETLDIMDLDDYGPHKDFKGSLNIRCKPLPGYESCISAGEMNKKAKSIEEKRPKKNK